MRDFKINEDQIQQTIESPDRTTRIDLNQDERDLRGIYPTGKNVFINIHLKKFKIDEKEIFLLIVTREPEGEQVHVTHGYKLTSKLIPNTEKLAPVDVLKGFSEKFGIDFIVDGDPRKFVRKAMLFPDEKGELPISEGRFPKDHDISFIQVMKQIPKKYAIIALQSVIDRTRYLEWLYTSKLI